MRACRATAPPAVVATTPSTSARKATALSIGTDTDPNGAFLNSSVAGVYCDNGAGGTGTLRSDTGLSCTAYAGPAWTGYTPEAELDLAPGATTTKVVTTLTTNDWFSLNEGPGGSVGETLLTKGPGTPPLGNGSAQLVVDSLGRVSLGTNAFAGTRLDAIGSIDYWANLNVPTGGSQPVAQFDVDLDSTDNNTTYEGRLSSLPGAPPAANTWTEYDALHGLWYWSHATNSDPCNQGAPCTWAQVLQHWPNAAIRNDSTAKGVFLLRLGGPIAGGAVSYVDDLTFATSTATTIVDFEGGASITPSLGPAGTDVTIRAYGFKPKARVKAVYNSGGAHPRKTTLCTTTANANGLAICTGTIPTGTRVGNVGVHQVTITGHANPKGSLKYVVDYVLSP